MILFLQFRDSQWTERGSISFEWEDTTRFRISSFKCCKCKEEKSRYSLWNENNKSITTFYLINILNIRQILCNDCTATYGNLPSIDVSTIPIGSHVYRNISPDKNIDTSSIDKLFDC